MYNFTTVSCAMGASTPRHNTWDLVYSHTHLKGWNPPFNSPTETRLYALNGVTEDMINVQGKYIHIKGVLLAAIFARIFPPSYADICSYMLLYCFCRA